MIPTRFFKVKGSGSFYYALIKAIDSGHALEIYDGQVSAIETKEDEQEVFSDMVEMSLAEVIAEMKTYEDKEEVKITEIEILEILSEDGICLLGVDNSLL